MNCLKKLFAALGVACITATSAYSVVVPEGTPFDLPITGTMEAFGSMDVVPVDNTFVIDVDNGNDEVVATIGAISNNTAGFAISFSSANGLTLMNGADAIPYLLTFDGTLVSGANVYETPTAELLSPRDLGVSVPALGPAAVGMALGDYTDVLTLTMVHN